MSLKVFTSNINYNGGNGFDITVKSGDFDFAPTWDMVWSHKNGTLSDDEYVEKYTKLMEDSYNRFPHKWEKLLSKEKVTLLCYCKKGKFCHRRLLAELLHLNFDNVEYIGEVNSKGELIQKYIGEQ